MGEQRENERRQEYEWAVGEGQREATEKRKVAEKDERGTRRQHELQQVLERRRVVEVRRGEKQQHCGLK